MPSADNLFKQFGPRSGPILIQKEQVMFEKKSADYSKHTQLPTRQRVTKTKIRQHLIYHLTFAQDTSFSVFIEMINPYYIDLAERLISTFC